MRFIPTAWLRPQGRLVVLFLAITVLPAGGLVWLGWTLIAEDRNLAETQLRARLEDAADQVVTDIAFDLEVLDARRITLEAASGALALTLTPDGVERHTGAPLLFGPWPALPEAPEATWQDSDAAERDNPEAALPIYRRLAESPDAATRAGALGRLARVHRTAGRFDEALDAWAAMRPLDDVALFGEPASLAAAQARLRTLAATDRTAELETEAAVLTADLLRGRWPIGRLTFQAAWTYAGEGDADMAEPMALAGAIDDIWQEWRGRLTANIRDPWDGRRTIESNGALTMVLSRADSGGLSILAAAPRFFADRWRPQWSTRKVLVTLEDGDGRRWIDEPGMVDPIPVRSQGDSGLPWTVRVASGMPDEELAAFAGRRQQILLVLLLAAFLAVAGAYFVARGVRRELAVAKLQSDFVSSVSHEFRTPLTSMSHLIELLRGRPDLEESRRGRYYDALEQEAGRLRRFVDQLLDFGRVDAGAAQYQFEAVQLAGLVEDVVTRFRSGPAARGHVVHCSANTDLPNVRVDAESFALALNNLLENAAKYSPPAAPIDVGVIRDDGADCVLVQVKDRGPGIPHSEHASIFDKFVRGADAVASGVRGTGVGLALAREIVRAHDGEITVDSDVGTGSTFVIALPMAVRSGADETARVTPRSSNFEVRS